MQKCMSNSYLKCYSVDVHSQVYLNNLLCYSKALHDVTYLYHDVIVTRNDDTHTTMFMVPYNAYFRYYRSQITKK